MAWLLFLDESGHSHKELPYEVRGGFAMADTQLWPFVQDALRLELSCFGARLAEYKSEIKGMKLLSKDRFAHAAQMPEIEAEKRQQLCRALLQAGLVMDEVEKQEDRRFVRRLQDYFTKTANGRDRSRWIVPSPFFVSSDMALPVQVADVVIYALNWGYRHPSKMKKETMLLSPPPSRRAKVTRSRVSAAKKPQFNAAAKS
jgi:hypothetical protein